jgi:phosphoribosylanthranilate isomerase
MSLVVKICGVTRRDDALAAVEAGADMIGVIFFPGSKRFVPLEKASKWLGDIPATVKRVGVFVDAPADEVAAALGSGLIDLAQLHGNESPAYCRQLGLPNFKAIRVRDPASLVVLSDFPGEIVMLDAPEPGSGSRFDWRLAAEAVRRHPQRRILLAGGLTPEGVRGAIESVHPWGVDVASGVESAPGVKDHRKVRRFISEAKASR